MLVILKSSAKGSSPIAMIFRILYDRICMKYIDGLTGRRLNILSKKLCIYAEENTPKNSR